MSRYRSSDYLWFVSQLLTVIKDLFNEQGSTQLSSTTTQLPLTRLPIFQLLSWRHVTLASRKEFLHLTRSPPKTRVFFKNVRISSKKFLFMTDIKNLLLHPHREILLFLFYYWLKSASLTHSICDITKQTHPSTYIRGEYDKFPDFFRMGTFIDSTHMKL